MNRIFEKGALAHCNYQDVNSYILIKFFIKDSTRQQSRKNMTDNFF